MFSVLARIALTQLLFACLSLLRSHGDVHSLLHSTGTALKWLQQGISWVVFMQDTNGLSLLSLPAMIGVSRALSLEVNSLAIRRYAKQAIGGIARLVHQSSGEEMTINVEYNQLDPLLRSDGTGQGDENDPSTGCSPYPGNINQLLFSLAPYVATLQRTAGEMYVCMHAAATIFPLRNT